MTSKFLYAITVGLFKENFGPNDVKNGTLSDLFKQAGVSDVDSFVDEVRHETRNGDISFSTPNRKLGRSTLENGKKLFETFKSLDKNGDGKITVEDVEILLGELGLGFVSKHLAAAIFSLVDADHNGKLDFRDLMALVAILQSLSKARKLK